MVSHAHDVRPSWDNVWLAIAHAMAQRSRCVRSAVGCIIVTPSQRIVASGYNGPPAGFEVPTEMCDGWCPRATEGGKAAFYDNCVSSHAEMNALVTGNRPDYEGGTLYVTRVPCFTCAKVIANSGVARVVCLIADEDIDREPEKSMEIMRASGLTVIWRTGVTLKDG